MPAWVGLSVSSVTLCVCVSVRALKETTKRLELSTPNVVHVLYGRTSAYIDLGVERSKVKVMRLWCDTGVDMHVDIFISLSSLSAFPCNLFNSFLGHNSSCRNWALVDYFSMKKKHFFVSTVFLYQHFSTYL